MTNPLPFGNQPHQPRTFGNLAELSEATSGMVRRSDGVPMPVFNASTNRYQNMGTNDLFTGMVPGVGYIRGGVKISDQAPQQHQNINQIALPKNPGLATAQQQMLNTLGQNLNTTLKGLDDYRRQADEVNAASRVNLAKASGDLDTTRFKQQLDDARTRWESNLNDQLDKSLRYQSGALEKYLASTGLPTMSSEMLRRGEMAFNNAALPVMGRIAEREAYDAAAVQNMRNQNAGRLNQLNNAYLASLQMPLTLGANVLGGFNNNLANLGQQDLANTYHALSTQYNGGVPGAPGYGGAVTNNSNPGYTINPVANNSEADAAWNLNRTMTGAGSALAGATRGASFRGGALQTMVNPNISYQAQQIQQQRPGISWEEAVQLANDAMPGVGIVS